MLTAMSLLLGEAVGALCGFNDLVGWSIAIGTGVLYFVLHLLVGVRRSRGGGVALVVLGTGGALFWLFVMRAGGDCPELDFRAPFIVWSAVVVAHGIFVFRRKPRAS
jgi:hypothetical protein